QHSDDGTGSEAELRLRLAVTVGVPEQAILKEETGNTTREESAAISELLAARNVHRILLVTESLHMRRAKYVFEHAGVEVHAVPADDFAVAAVSPADRILLTARIVQES